MADPLPKPQHWFAPGVNTVRDVMVRAFECAKALSVGYPVEVIVRPVKSRRSLIQNAKMWAMLADVSRQVQWPVNGIMETLDSEDWKSLITAAAQQETRVAAGLSGGAVMLGVSTRKMTTQQMADVIEYLHAFGADKGVVWSERAKQEVPDEWEST
jgi:hypothetical protein